MAIADEVLDAVREDPALTPSEKETSILFAKPDDRARVFTAEAGLVRRLLQHPEFQPRYYLPEDGPQVESTEALVARDTALVGVAGTLPVGVLKVRSSARETSHHAPVISAGAGGAPDA